MISIWYAWECESQLTTLIIPSWLLFECYPRCSCILLVILLYLINDKDNICLAMHACSCKFYFAFYLQNANVYLFFFFWMYVTSLATFVRYAVIDVRPENGWRSQDFISETWQRSVLVVEELKSFVLIVTCLNFSTDKSQSSFFMQQSAW